MALSKDGTRIGYTRSGSGPALVLVQGAMGTAAEYAGLAAALRDTYDVWVPDRRGRGLSPKPWLLPFLQEAFRSEPEKGDGLHFTVAGQKRLALEVIKGWSNLK